MHRPKPPVPPDSLLRWHYDHRVQRIKRLLRFRLRTLWIWVSVLCLLATLVHFFGAASWQLACHRFDQLFNPQHAISAQSVLGLPIFFACLIIGLISFLAALWLEKTDGQWLVIMLSFAGLIMLLVGLGLNTAPLSETKFQQLEALQMIRLALLVLAIAPTIGAVLGWCCRRAASPFERDLS